MFRYDPKTDVSAFRGAIEAKFGQNSVPLSALEYLTKTMNAANGYSRYDGSDYFVHPLAAAEILLKNADADEETVSVALLHDCAEDIPGCDEKFLSGKFGEKIAKKVTLLTKLPGVDYHTEENMKAYLCGILSDRVASLVKVADRMNNNSTMTLCTEEKRAYKTEETRKYYPDFCRKAAEKYPESASFYKKAEVFFLQDIE